MFTLTYTASLPSPDAFYEPAEFKVEFEKSVGYAECSSDFFRVRRFKLEADRWSRTTLRPILCFLVKASNDAVMLSETNQKRWDWRIIVVVILDEVLTIAFGEP